MARGKPVHIPRHQFPTKKDATLYFREILHRYEIGGRIEVEDARDLMALLEYHSERDEKIGCGIDYFSVMPQEYGQRCFEIVRVDGSRIDFSYPHCIENAMNATARGLQR